MFQDTAVASEAGTESWTPGTLPSVNMTALAREALANSGGDRDRAAGLFLRQLKLLNPAEYEARVAASVRVWADQVIRNSDNARRHIIERGAIPDPSGRPVSRQALSSESLRAAAFAWFDWPVLPGVALRDATRAELNEAAQSYFKNSSIMARRANWLSAISEKLPDGSAKVSEVLTESDVARMAGSHRVEH